MLTRQESKSLKLIVLVLPIICALFLAILFPATSAAQAPDSAKGPTFEVASMRLAEPPGRAFERPQIRGGPGTSDPTRFGVSFIGLRTLIEMAWGRPSFAILGPQSLLGSAYDIEAKLPLGTARDEFRLMLQQLLIERLSLAVHTEPREQVIYELVIAKGGPKLHAAEPLPASDTASDGQEPIRQPRPDVQFDKSGNPHITPGQRGTVVIGTPTGSRLLGRAQRISDLASALEDQVGRRIVDMTGLGGRYDFSVDFTRESYSGTMRNGAPTGENPSEPQIFQAIQDQLGLKLKAGKGLVDILVVDHFNKIPTEN